MTSNDYKKFSQLSWKILEWKLIYYHPNLIHTSWFKKLSIEDREYDHYEDEYKTLASKLGLKPTASDMVGFDESRPSCKLVLSKLQKPKGIKLF
jgi:hypothetical protein